MTIVVLALATIAGFLFGRWLDRNSRDPQK